MAEGHPIFHNLVVLPVECESVTRVLPGAVSCTMPEAVFRSMPRAMPQTVHRAMHEAVFHDMVDH